MLCKNPVLCEPRQMTRAERRAIEHRGEGQKRVHMRQMFEALGKTALATNDHAIMLKLDKYRPFVRVKNPVSIGIDAAHKELHAYLEGVQQDLREYEREKNMEEHI